MDEVTNKISNVKVIGVDIHKVSNIIFQREYLVTNLILQYKGW